MVQMGIELKRCNQAVDVRKQNVYMYLVYVKLVNIFLSINI